MSRFALFSLAMILALPAAAHEEDETHDHDDGHAEVETEGHLTEMDGLRAVHAWTPEPEGDEILVYVELENASDGEIVLQGGEAGIAERVELVGFTLVDGEPTFEPLPSVPLQPGRDLVL